MDDNLNVVDATQGGVVDQPIDGQVEATTNEPVNAGNEEVTPSQVEVKPVQSAEDNARYAEIRRKAEADAEVRARDKVIAEMFGESHGLKTYAAYQEAVTQAEQEAREQEIRQEYESKGVPEELIEELVESKKDREERNREKAERAQVEAQQRDYQAFLTEYPNVKADEIPQEVWLEVNNGKSLVDAYAKHEVKNLKSKIAEYESKLKANETNEANASSSTGSLTGNGIGDTGFISFENFEANKGDQRWVMKNLSKIQESRAKW